MKRESTGNKIKISLFVLLATSIVAPTAIAQQDPMQKLNDKVSEDTNGKLRFTFSERTRWEEKDGVNFGKSVNQQDMLSRIFIGADFKPLPWLKISAMGRDSRVPFYGLPAPNSVRDPMDLQEGYVELFGDRKDGFGAIAGRQMLTYGEARLIGTPMWSNVPRAFDTARLYYRVHGARLEVLMVSPVMVLPDQFNKPELGERIVGTYDTFSNVWHGMSVDAYALVHSQNRIGGWTGAGTLGTQSYGGRAYGKLPAHFTYSWEGVGQTGHWDC